MYVLLRHESNLPIFIVLSLNERRTVPHIVLLEHFFMGEHDDLPLFFSSLIKVPQPLMVTTLQLVHVLISLALSF